MLIRPGSLKGRLGLHFDSAGQDVGRGLQKQAAVWRLAIGRVPGLSSPLVKASQVNANHHEIHNTA
jgi:hypothetical protein